MNAVCHSVNIDGVVALLGDGGNTSTLHVVIKLVALSTLHIIFTFHL